MSASRRRRLTHRSAMQLTSLCVCTPPHAFVSLHQSTRAWPPCLPLLCETWRGGVCSYQRLQADVPPQHFDASEMFLAARVSDKLLKQHAALHVTLKLLTLNSDWMMGLAACGQKWQDADYCLL